MAIGRSLVSGLISEIYHIQQIHDNLRQVTFQFENQFRLRRCKRVQIAEVSQALHHTASIPVRAKTQSFLLYENHRLT